MTVTMAATGVLDTFDHLYAMQRFFPQFAKRELEAEGTWVLNKVSEYLNDLGELAKNHGKFMHLMRLM